MRVWHSDVRVPKDYQNKKCYQVLQNRTEPCAFCTTKRLQKGKFYRWSYTNPRLKRTYALKDTLVELDGRTYRLELAIDMGVQGEAQSVEPESVPETPFQTFVRHNYFDEEAFFKSVAIPEAPYYLYFGDLQSNLYYISDNMRDDFGFESNIVQDLIEKWGKLISDDQDRASVPSGFKPHAGTETGCAQPALPCDGPEGVFHVGALPGDCEVVLGPLGSAVLFRLCGAFGE